MGLPTLDRKRFSAKVWRAKMGYNHLDIKRRNTRMTKSSIAIILVPFCNLAWAAPDLNEAAEDVCDCLEAPYAQAQQAMELIIAAQASGDMSALMAAQGEMMAVMNAGSQCFDALTVKYPEISQSEELQEQVMNIADEQCPNPAAAMSTNQ